MSDFKVGDKVATANGLRDIESGALMDDEHGVVESVRERHGCFGTGTTTLYEVRLENGQLLQMLNGAWLKLR
jgi:hypothetical protein